MATQHHSTTSPSPKKHFLISYTEADKTWAEWVAWHLEEYGYSTILPDWDFHPGSNEVYELHKATILVEHIIPIFSQKYIHTLYTHPEWTTAFRSNIVNEENRLLPIRIEPCNVEGFLGSIKTIDLFGLEEKKAQDAIIQAIKGERRKRQIAPRFPGKETNYLGTKYDRNPLFVGREDSLRAVYSALYKGATVAVTHKISSNVLSVGKTQIAIEYVYRYQSNYEHILWVQDNPLSDSLQQFIDSAYKIAEHLGLLHKDKLSDTTVITALRQWLETHTDWLLVLDGVKDYSPVLSLLPRQQQGHILITSRERTLASIAHLVEIDMLSTEEKELSNRLKNLIDAALRSPSKHQIHLQPGDNTIGRAPDNTIIWDEPSIDNYHARITINDDTSYVVDLNSIHGTFLNEQRLLPQKAEPLKPKDRILIGNIDFVFAPESTSLLTSSNNMTLTSQLNSSQLPSASFTPLLPMIDDANEIIKRIKRDDTEKGWQVFHSEKVSFHDFRDFITNLHSIYRWALVLISALTVIYVALLIALSIDDGIAGRLFLLFTIFISFSAIALFAGYTVDVMQQGPALQLGIPYPEALLVLTENGFVEYIDSSQIIDCVAFADLAAIEQRGEGDDIWLDLSYLDGRKGQWNQRAHFGPPSYILQTILKLHIQYVQKYCSSSSDISYNIVT